MSKLELLKQRLEALKQVIADLYYTISAEK